MNKFFTVVSVLSVILNGCNFNVEAKGRGGRSRSGHSHRVSAHSRKITTTKNGVTHTRTVHVKAHNSK